MRIDKVRLRQFRNYAALELEFDSGVQLFSGFNAQGKTNLLEAIFLSAMGKSFRTGSDEEMIAWAADEGTVELAFSNRLANHELAFRFRRGEKRENRLNGRGIGKRDLIGLMNAVLFSPEDLWLIKGSPAGRRRFLDFAISQSDSVYYRDLISYNRTLLQRNQLLKKIGEGSEKTSTLEVWDEQLVAAAVKVTAKRLERSEILSKAANRVHAGITGGAECFSARYFIYGGAPVALTEYEPWFREKLLGSRGKDIARGTTELGPHKDDLEFCIDSYAARAYASQGQQRTIVLALKLAEIEIIREISGEYPVLLLDDVMSELDEQRKQNLLAAISGKIQTFVTGTEELTCLRSLSHQCFAIDGGRVYRRERTL